MVVSLQHVDEEFVPASIYRLPSIVAADCRHFWWADLANRSLVRHHIWRGNRCWERTPIGHGDEAHSLEARLVSSSYENLSILQDFLAAETAAVKVELRRRYVVEMSRLLKLIDLDTSKLQEMSVNFARRADEVSCFLPLDTTVDEGSEDLRRNLVSIVEEYGVGGRR